MTRVLLDATAVPADRGGVGRYVDGLLGGLSGLGADVTVVCQAADADVVSGLAPALDVVAAPARIAGRAPRMAWEQTGLPLLVRRVRADVLHCPHYTMPLAPVGVPVVVTVHDLTFFTDPGVHTAGKGRFFRAATRHAARRAARVVVPSAATGAELTRITGARRVDVAFHGVDTAVFHPPTEAEKTRAAGTFGSYVAFLGTLEPRKNLPALVRGWAAAVAGRDDPPALVLAGGPGWDAAALDAAVADVPAGLTVVRPGYLDLADLPGYLGGAVVVAYPSLGEGFGLPVLEAMACGAAVLTTRRLALPEVGGDAVAYCDVDAESVGAALTALLDDPVRRSALGAAGALRAAGFTWTACAEAHLRSWDETAR